MRPTLLRRFIAGLAALALIVTMGVQGVQAVAMAAMTSDMSMSMAAPTDTAGKCTNCEGSEEGTVMHCQTVSMCAPSVAVLPMAAPISVQSLAMQFEAETMSFDGRTGMPELHPPKSAALR